MGAKVVLAQHTAVQRLRAQRAVRVVRDAERGRVLLGREEPGDGTSTGSNRDASARSSRSEHATRLLVAVELADLRIARGARPGSSLVDLHREQDLVVLGDRLAPIEQRLVGPASRVPSGTEASLASSKKCRQRVGVRRAPSLEHLQAPDCRSTARQAREHPAPAIEPALVLGRRQQADGASTDGQHRGVRAEPSVLEDAEFVPVGDGHAQNLAAGQRTGEGPASRLACAPSSEALTPAAG